MRSRRTQRQTMLALMALSLSFGALGAGMVALVLLLPPEHFQGLVGSAIVGIAGLVLKSCLVRKLSQWISGERPIEPKPFNWRSLMRPEFIYDEHLTQRVKAIAERIEIKVQEVKVNTTLKAPLVSSFNGTVIVSQTLLDLSPPEEQDFLIARALAKSKMGERWLTKVGMVISMLPFGIGIPILATRTQPLFFAIGILQNLVGILGLALISLSLTSLTLELERRLIDEEAVDRLALSATKNLEATESALRKLAQWKAENWRRYISPQAVPLLEQQIQQELSEDLQRLHRIAKELGMLV